MRPAFQGVEQLAMVGVVHHADNRFAVGDDGHIDRHRVQAVKKTAGAVDRVDKPTARGRQASVFRFPRRENHPAERR